jgi:hypothetical protein
MRTYDMLNDKEFVFYSSVEIVVNLVTISLLAFILICYTCTCTRIPFCYNKFCC